MNAAPAQGAGSKLITAILPTEVDALKLIKRLRFDLGILTGNLHFARGMGRITRDDGGRAGDRSQREVVSVVVEAARGDEVFDWLFDAADINRPHGGILYMQSLAEATEYTLPDVPEEEGEPQG